jgi:hypothetical protein
MEKEQVFRSVSDQEQRSFIKICYLLDKDGPFIHLQLKKALPGRALAKRTVEKWLADFRGGRTATFDENRSGRPRSARDDHNIAMIKDFLELQ